MGALVGNGYIQQSQHGRWNNRNGGLGKREIMCVTVNGIIVISSRLKLEHFSTSSALCVVSDMNDRQTEIE